MYYPKFTSTADITEPTYFIASKALIGSVEYEHLFIKTKHQSSVSGKASGIRDGAFNLGPDTHS